MIKIDNKNNSYFWPTYDKVEYDAQIVGINFYNKYASQNNLDKKTYPSFN